MARWNQLKICVAFAIAFALSGCATTDSCDGCKDEKPAKFLFTWQVGPKEEEKKDEKKNGNGKKDGEEKTEGDAKDKNGETEKKNGNGEQANGDANGGEEEEEKPKPIETDRPDFVEASSTVPGGRIQLECGYTYFRDRDGDTRIRSHSYPEALLRIGLNDWFELRLGQNFSSDKATSPTFVESISGAEDLYIGTKLALTEQKKYLPEMALVLQSLVPSGRDGFTAKQMLPGFNWLYGWDIIDDCLSFAGSTQVNRAFDGGDHYHVEFAQALTVGYTLTEKLGAYTEWFAIFPTSANGPDIGPEHYVDGGFTYNFTDDFKYDIRAGIGLNRHAADFFAGTGFSVRY